MGRLDIEKQNRLQGERMRLAKKQIELLGYLVFQIDETTLTFQYRDHDIKYHAYSGWASGKTIKDGRGLSRLINQIK